jgi:hypothetical protein
MLATLVITFNCPALAFVEETKQKHHIRNAYELLRPWEHLPMIRRGLDRIRILMRQAGLGAMSDLVEEHHSFPDPCTTNLGGDYLG